MRLHHKIALMAITCFLSVSYLFAAIPAGYTGTPFSFDTLKGKPQQIPGIVKAVFFDNGGEGVAYHDNSAGNTGGTMRLNATNQQIAADINVDMQSYSGNDWDVVGYGTNDQHDSSLNATITTWHLSWIDASGPTTVGDWVKCTIHVNTAGNYSIDFKQANVNAPPNLETLTFFNGTLVRIDSIKNLPAVVNPPGCPEPWHAWTVNMNVDTITLDTGLQVVQLTFITGSWNFDWMRFRLLSTSVSQQPANRNPTAGSFGLKTIMSGDELKLSYNRSGAGEARISLVNCAGKSVLSSIERSGAVGQQSRIINLRNMRPGVYIVSVEQNGCREVKSFSLTH
jgi:hypothetical protein